MPLTPRDNYLKYITELPNGSKVDIRTGEVVSNPVDTALNRLRSIRFENNKQSTASSRPAPKTTKPSGKSIAFGKTVGDPFDEDISKRPKGNAKTRYMRDYVMNEKLRNANRRAQKYDAGKLPTSVKDKQYKKEVTRMLLDFKARYPSMSIDESHLMHINPLSSGGKNAWSNLRLGPKGLNIDQAVAHPSAYRQLPSEEVMRFGAKGRGVAQYWEGISTDPGAEPSINTKTGLRKPVSPKGLGVKGLGAFGMALSPISAIAQLAAAKANDKPFSFDDFMGALLGVGNINKRPEGPMA